MGWVKTEIKAKGIRMLPLFKLEKTYDGRNKRVVDFGIIFPRPKSSRCRTREWRMVNWGTGENCETISVHDDEIDILTVSRSPEGILGKISEMLGDEILECDSTVSGYIPSEIIRTVWKSGKKIKTLKSTFSYENIYTSNSPYGEFKEICNN